DDNNFLKINSILSDDVNSHFIFYGDVWASLQGLNDNSIDCVITSPPYWGQRDYEFEGQIGNEVELREYISKLVIIFGLLREKLVSEGIFYLNIGDKYISKYGNTPLGMTPYQLAYQMVRDGWILNDILIWYKPNHMPSSVKNRFTNTYEPIFVFSRSTNNYYTKYQESLNKDQIISILKIPVQKLEYRHMASFPERLVIELLKFGIRADGIILDPFAGSGTTTKAIITMNESIDLGDRDITIGIKQFIKYKFKSILIEANSEYIDIIKKRCRIRPENIINFEYLPIPTKQINSLRSEIIDTPGNIIYSQEDEELPVLVKFLKTEEEFYQFTYKLAHEETDYLISDDGLLFLGLPSSKIDLIWKLIQLTKNRWVIRNMIVYPKGKKWRPIFMLVKDIKSVGYKFDLDKIRLQHKTSNLISFDSMNFLGTRVKQPSSYFLHPKDGIITKIMNIYPNGLPKTVMVQWKNQDYSFEEIIDPNRSHPLVQFNCPKCDSILKKYHHYNRYLQCPICSITLWKSIDTIPKLIEIFSINENIQTNITQINTKKKKLKNEYTGKFKDSNKINRGQSPGARSSVEEEYFTYTRYYHIKQSLVCDYLNLYRKERGFTKTAITRKFPSEYKHTVGHWFRKDMGGSLPKPEDLKKLNQILSLDSSYVNYISRFGLKLQAVIPHRKGKNPGDFLEMNESEIQDLLYQLGTP
ncbi:MAG: site-specific DNA-methyltransferase, partial [Candidatus Heimdallarchaeota archaeon]|nr:site-specific DNA-methyltransferase [Candidatus Heimdallarchaeota archaeon]